MLLIGSDWNVAFCPIKSCWPRAEAESLGRTSRQIKMQDVGEGRRELDRAGSRQWEPYGEMGRRRSGDKFRQLAERLPPEKDQPF